MRGPLTAFTVAFLLWISSSFLIFEIGRVIPVEEAWTAIIAPFSLGVFLILASLITAVHLIHAEPAFRNHPERRVGCLLFSVAIGAGLFFGARMTGAFHSVIYMVATANLLVFANLLGAWIITPLRRPAEMLPLCLIMSLADLFSLVSGPTKKMAESLDTYYRSGMKGPAPIGDFIVIKIAAPGSNHLLPVFGLADWVIIAFLCAASARFGIHDNLAGKSMADMVRDRRAGFYLPVAVIGLFLAVISAHTAGIFLPALPVVAFCYIAYGLAVHPPLRRPRQSDWKLMIITLLLMGGFMAARCYLF